MAPRTFTSEPNRRQPIPFILQGDGQLSGTPWSEEFTAVPEPPAGVMDDMAASMGTDEQGRRVWNQVSLLRFFRGVLVDEDVERFDALVHDKDRLVRIQMLGDVMLWLVEELSQVPTVQPSSSTPGRLPTPTISAVG